MQRIQDPASPRDPRAANPHPGAESLTGGARRRRPGGRVLGSWALFLAAASLGSSCDNPACVFGTASCQGSGGGPGVGVGEAAALMPIQFEWLEPLAPGIEVTVPSGGVHGASAPMVVRFSESLNPDSIDGAFELVSDDPFGPPVPLSGSVVGDGRVVVLIAASQLPAGPNYSLQLTEDAAITDLQGSALTDLPGAVLTTFAIDQNPPTEPQVLTSWPPDNAVGMSAFGELVVVFDRPMDPTSFNDNSYAVTVGGMAPMFDPAPAALQISGPGGTSVSDPRVYLWRSVDGTDVPVSLGSNAMVQLDLSTGAALRDSEGEVLDPITIDFTTAPILTPLAASLISAPNDAINIDNLMDGGSLQVQVDLEDAQPGDALDIYVFGTVDGMPAQLVNFLRRFEITSATMSVVLTEAELDLASSGAPVVARVLDGEVGLGFTLRRGLTVTPVRMLDIDPSTIDVDHPLLDSVAPTLFGFGPEGLDAAVFRSDLRDLSLVGVANEELRSVEVTTPLGDNGSFPPVIGSNNGLFVAAPVPVGIVDPAAFPGGLGFTATVYDEALNASAPIQGTFFQRGATGPGTALPGPATVTVQVLEAGTLRSVQGATVFTHSDQSPLFPLLDDDVTGASGTAVLAAAAVGETLVTVDAPGFGLVTVHGVPRDRLSIVLEPDGLATALAGGFVRSSNEDITLFERYVADSRAPSFAEPFTALTTCLFNPLSGTYDCAYGPAPIETLELGASAFVLLDTPPDEFNYSHLTFLRGFGLRTAMTPQGAAGLSALDLTLGTLLDEPGIDPELRPIDAPAVDWDDSALVLVDGAPRVDVRAQVRGLPRTTPVGAGIGFDLGGGMWRARSAYAGEADGIQDVPSDALGALVADGVIDGDLFLSIESRDGLGSRSGRRPRLSSVPASLAAPTLPVVSSPVFSATTPGASYDVVFDDVIPDSLGMGGLYRVQLIGSNGRVWTLWRADAPDAQGPNQSVHVPDLSGAATPGMPLPSGTVASTVAAFAWPGLDFSQLVFTDIDREYQFVAERVGHVFSQP